MLTGHGHDRREAPTVDSAVPLAVRRAADLAVQADIAGKNVIVSAGAVYPGIDVFEKPALVLILVREHVGVGCETGGVQVDRIVPERLVVLDEVGEHLLVTVFAMAERREARCVERVAGPVKRGGLAHQRAAAAVEY